MEIKTQQIPPHNINKMVSIIKLDKAIKDMLIDKITKQVHHQLVVFLGIPISKIKLNINMIM